MTAHFDDTGSVARLSAARAGSAARRSRLVRAAPATPDDWADARESDAFALPEQSSEWIGAITASSRSLEASRAYHFADGTTTVVPLVRSQRVRLWSPPPAWGVGGTVGGELDASMLAEIVADLRSLPALSVAVRIDARHEEIWHAATRSDDVRLRRRSHVIDLHAGPDEHLASLGRTTRYKLRRAAKKGVEIEIDRTGRLLDTHYELFLLSVGRWAEKQREPEWLALARAKRRDPLSKLQAMQDALGDRMIAVVASVDGEAAASAIALLGPTTRYTRGAINRELAAPTNAAYAVQWAAIEQAYSFGSRRYHMGESGESDGISSFKEQFGATAVEHHEYRFERLPITSVTNGAKNLVKRAIGFRDT